jgi:acetyl-CoA carboxylase carboxyl transferase subunit beta
MVDMVVHRQDLRSTLARLCSLLMMIPANATPSGAEARTNGESDLEAAGGPSSASVDAADQY